QSSLLLSVCLFFRHVRVPPSSPLFPYTTLFRSRASSVTTPSSSGEPSVPTTRSGQSVIRRPTREGSDPSFTTVAVATGSPAATRSEEHTSELQSRENLVCRLLLEKKKYTHKRIR